MKVQILLTALALSVAEATEIPPGFVSLFNGKDLSGWRGNPGHWTVEEGTIVGRTDGSLKRNRFLIWEGGRLQDFELRLQVRVSKGGNSGVQYRSRERPDLGDWILSGYQSDVLPAVEDLNGMFYEEQGRRILGRTGQKVVVDRFGMPWVVGEMEVKDFPPEQWRDYRLLVRGNHHQHWIDGHKTADAIDDDVAGRSLEGLLGVQVHVGPAMKVEYRDIWLKQLPRNEVLPEESEIPATAFLVRPQQRLPKGWTPPKRGVLVAELAQEKVEWDQLIRRGFTGERSFEIEPGDDATHLRVWIGGPAEEEFEVHIDGKTIFSGKRVNPTWQLLNLPLKGGKLVTLKASTQGRWAEPSLWQVDKVD